MIHRLISTASAAFPTGMPTQNRLFQLATGPFAGRLVAVFARTPSVLSWSCADPPFTSWSAAADFVADAADDPCSAFMDDHGNLYVAYAQQGTGALRCVKLTYVSGMWATQTPATVYDSDTSTSRYPSLLKDLYSRIWIAWTRDDAGVVTLRVKRSIDDGLTFGAGPTDAGTDLSGATTEAYGHLVARGMYLHCLFAVGGTILKGRSIDLDAGIWNPSETLYTGTGLGRDLCAAVAPDGTLGVLFCADGSLLLKEFDGAVWGALQAVTSSPALSPALRYAADSPQTLFLRSIGTSQQQYVESHRSGGEFTAPTDVLSQLAPLATLLCFDADAGTPYADLTIQASGNTGADVFHPVSGALVAHSGDAVYFGAEDRFSQVRVLLSTVGSGGVIAWSYWNGAEWMAFVPASGGYHFDSANMGVRLFVDGVSTPTDWQKSLVNNINRYWIRASVTGAFSTPPIGSQLTAVADSSNLIPLRV